MLLLCSISRTTCPNRSLRICALYLQRTSKVDSFLGKVYTIGYGYIEETPTILIPGLENLKYRITDRDTVEGLIKNKLPGK
jgi:hypothetical protein